MEMTAAKLEVGVTPEVFSALYPRLYHMALLAEPRTPAHARVGEGESREKASGIDDRRVPFHSSIRTEDHSVRHQFGQHHPLRSSTREELFYEDERIPF
jgi:hypothetical protein